jgi:hypothetical protein
MKNLASFGVPLVAGLATVWMMGGVGATSPSARRGESCCSESAEQTAKPTDALPGVKADDVRAAFNRAKESTRVVTLLSPTCPVCQDGQKVIARAIRDLPAASPVKTFVVWLSMRPGDSPERAANEASWFSGPQVSNSWDATGEIGDRFGRTLALKGRAWDVYAVYAPGVEWNGADPPKPTFWMHQLTAAAGADQTLCLQADRFIRELKTIAATRR